VCVGVCAGVGVQKCVYECVGVPLCACMCVSVWLCATMRAHVNKMCVFVHVFAYVQVSTRKCMRVRKFVRLCDRVQGDK